jgi:hypothetical protein
VIVVSHQAPGEDPPLIEITDFSSLFDELLGLQRFIEGELAAGDAAVDVIGGAGDKKARFSGHGIPPMRGRVILILLRGPQKSRSIDYEGWHPLSTH